MKRNNLKTFVIGAAIALAVGGLSALFTMDSMEIYAQNVIKPPLAPPGWVFSVAWTILYTLMGVGAAVVWLAPESDTRSKALNLYVAQLIVNFFWSPIFFNAQAYGFAVLWLMLLWTLVLLMIQQFRKVDRKAARLQIPYLIWLTFALYLNVAVWLLN